MDNSVAYLKNELLECRNQNEFAEVTLKNLLKLVDNEQKEFTIPFDDVLVAIEATIKLLTLKR